jgi:hypothetical protein
MVSMACSPVHSREPFVIPSVEVKSIAAAFNEQRRAVIRPFLSRRHQWSPSAIAARSHRSTGVEQQCQRRRLVAIASKMRR